MSSWVAHTSGRLLQELCEHNAFVIECEGSNIAIDDEIAQNICVWQIAAKEAPSRPVEVEKPKRKGL